MHTLALLCATSPWGVRSPPSFRPAHRALGWQDRHGLAQDFGLSPREGPGPGQSTGHTEEDETVGKNALFPVYGFITNGQIPTA